MLCNFSHLAPQLQVRLDDAPRFLSPLVSTAQSAVCNAKDDLCSLEDTLHEPQSPSDPSSLIQALFHATLPPDSNCITTRIKRRKRAFNKLYASRSKTPKFDPDSEYTFEFFQHLISFDDFSLNFMNPIGKHRLNGMLNGQPLKFMAAHQIQERCEGGETVGEQMRWLWSFDLWHESLYEDSKYQ